jgi:hypothetical protein
MLTRHLAECPGCRTELDDLKAFHATLLRAGSFAPEQAELDKARTALHSTVRSLRMKRTMWDRLIAFTTDALLPRYKTALGAVALVAAGVLIGRVMFPGAAVPSPSLAGVQPSATPDGESRIANIRFVNSDPAGGEIEFTFDAVTPVHMRGSINDDRVQKVLAHAMVNDQNPGNRLRSVNAFASQVQNLRLPDREVKAALISALRSDDNPGVRREAIRTLQHFPFDDEIKQVFLHVLMKDPNPALRMAAINSLDSARTQGQAAGSDLLDVLKQRMQSDENTYVRIRAKAVLEEVRNQ